MHNKHFATFYNNNNNNNNNNPICKDGAALPQLLMPAVRHAIRTSV